MRSSNNIANIESHDHQQNGCSSIKSLVECSKAIIQKRDLNFLSKEDSRKKFRRNRGLSIKHFLCVFMTSGFQWIPTKDGHCLHERGYTIKETSHALSILIFPLRPRSFGIFFFFRLYRFVFVHLINS